MKKPPETIYSQLCNKNFFIGETLTIIFLLGVITAGGVFAKQYYDKYQAERQQLITDQENLNVLKDQLSMQLGETTTRLDSATVEIADLKSEDQRIKNNTLQEEIKNIQSTFQNTIKSYEQVLDLRGDGAKTQALEDGFSAALAQLSKRNYASASATLTKLNKDISTLQAQLAAAAAATGGINIATVKASNSAPASGYTRQVVENEAGKFIVDLVAADLGSTRVQVETASAGDCKDNCPVAALADFVGRSGGFAGINGPYFCPASYPSCAGKTNSYDTLIMNKSKTFFNSDNNVYSTVPAFIFSGNSARLENSSNVGRDGGYDAVIAAQPALIRGGNVAFGGDGDPKTGSRGSRSFIAVKGNTVYIGVVRGATVAEVARVLKTLGMDSALNLDSGGSTAFMANGKYVAGPGRTTPFGIVLVRK